MNSRIAVVVRHKPNRKRLVLRALEAVKRQTWPALEVHILLMGGPVAIDSLQHLEYAGLEYQLASDSAQLLAALASSTADYVAVLDDDDTWAPEFLARLVSLQASTCETYPNVRAMACYVSQVNEMAEGHRLIIDNLHGWNQQLEAGLVALDIVKDKDRIPVSSCLFQSAAFRALAVQHALDQPGFFWPFFIEFLSQHDVWLVPEVMAFRHLREATDFNTGNFSMVQRELAQMWYRQRLHEMLRRCAAGSCLAQQLGLVMSLAGDSANHPG